MKHICSVVRQLCFEKHLTATFFIATALLLILGAASTDYATKGEPREALVAVEMLRSGNWILPVDASGDMAYKPPLFHWLVALFSLPIGHVTEFTSRLPSVLALLLMLAALRKFAGRSREMVLLSCLMCLTSFEVFRAGVNCRVDMLLASLMTCASVGLWTGSWRGYLIAVAGMSGAVLTKGPVGALLPLALWWLWAVMCAPGTLGRRLTGATFRALALGILSLLLPAVWYWLAYRQGGERFLALALEENFGRLTGTMSYASHEKPFWYNAVMVASGLLPWSALLLASLCRSPWRWMRRRTKETRLGRGWLRQLTLREIFAWVMVAGVLIFYTIPKSKRGVYLLPLYPFAAWLMADYVILYARRYSAMLQIAKWTGIISMALYALIYLVAWPIIVNGRSDRHVALEIESRAGLAPIYTYINSRMDRFYGVDFYLGVRLKPLLPSGQVVPMPAGGYTPSMIEMPADSLFYLCVTERDAREQGSLLTSRMAVDGYSLTEIWRSPRKTRDMGQPLVLYKAERK